MVFARDSGLTAADLQAVAAARSAVERLAGHVTGLGDPSRAQRSADGEADAFTADVTAAASSQTSTDTAAVQAIRQAVRSASDGLQAAVTGSAAVNTDSGVSGQRPGRPAAHRPVIIMVILIVVYRSPLLWLLPLFGSLGAIIVAESAAHGLADAGLTVSTLSASILRCWSSARPPTTRCCSSTVTGKNSAAMPPPRTRWPPRCERPCPPCWPPPPRSPPP